LALHDALRALSAYGTPFSGDLATLRQTLGIDG
jgi:hypothetical protein